ncbi:hypothetical protein [Caulobacter soli]|uniref:hypothetical protein n=1 Tax=Caulobacter soli TaxID=2708539 RepID=UPI0013EE2DD4|nr:hypothetical protein [Caulobacter soli]
MAEIDLEILTVLRLAEAGRSVMTDVGVGDRGADAVTAFYLRRKAVDHVCRAKWVGPNGTLTDPAGVEALARLGR